MNQYPKSLSILIATHNRVKLLLQTLQSLSELAVPDGVNVELIVCANACSDSTAEACLPQLARLPFRARCLIEPSVGLSVARNRLIAESTGEILAFLDDDVWVTRGWIGALLAVFTDYPADIVTGRVELWWQAVQKPQWFSRRSAHMLSCVDHGTLVCELFSAGQAIGANMAFRRRILQAVPEFRTDLGRSGERMVASDDTDFVARSMRAKYRLFYAPQASLLHWVAPERITLEYLGSAAEGIGTAKVLMLPEISTRKYLQLWSENRIKLAMYRTLRLLCTMIGYQKGRVNHHIRHMMCRGVLSGLNQRRPSR